MEKLDVKYKNEIIGYTTDDGKSVQFLDTQPSKNFVKNFVKKGNIVGVSSRKGDIVELTYVVEQNDNRILKSNHKNLMIIEAGFIYCKRHDLNEETFIENEFMSEMFDSHEGGEFDNICKDLLWFRYNPKYELIEISVEEYELCVDKFGEQ